MKNRCGFLLLVSVVSGLTGCAATTKIGEGRPTFPPQAWNQAPAPQQRTVASTVPTANSLPVATEDILAAKPAGLARYFPGFQRVQPEPPKVVARYRPTWFGLRPNPASQPPQATNYMTDARSGLNQPSGDPLVTLPVAIQVPPPRPTNDRAVTPTALEQPTIGTKDDAVATPPVAQPAMDGPDLPQVVSSEAKAAKPVNDEVNPLPPAIEPGQTVTLIASRMPEVPSVDPLAQPKVTQTPPVPPVVDSAPLPTAPASTPSQQPNPPNDEKARKAITEPMPSNPSEELTSPMVPASYSSASVLVAQQAVGFKKHADHKVLASPQSPPPRPQVKPSPQAAPTPQAQVKPTSQAVPTSLTKPTPQATTLASGQSCEPANASTGWKRPCLRRLIRKVYKLGEYADPPTAAPH